MFTNEFILSMKRKALRRGVWFKALDQLERGIFSLTVQVVEGVESVKLGVIIVKIMRKLCDAWNSEFVKRIELGTLLAKRLAAQAVAWGYADAESWASENDFIIFLTIDVRKQMLNCLTI